ncbi:MAG: DUF3883 domain-containing protein, partial [Dehalococcoidia bacterium]|nr:DUF3883 domain-containing protein [Dehalococcoidia bacterium]
RDGRLRNPNQAYIDDYPQLAELLGGSVPIADDQTQGTLRFYGLCGVKRLSEAAILSGTRIGNPLDEPSRIGATKTRRQLDSGTFRSGLTALINREISERPRIGAAPLLVSNLPRIQALIFVDAISQEYQVDSECVTIQARHLWKGETLHVVSPQNRAAFRDTVSYAVAEAVIGSSSSARMFVPAISRLFECDSPEEINEFLAHLGIPWRSNLPFESWAMEEETDWYEDGQDPDGDSIVGRIGNSLTANLIRRAGQNGVDRSPPSEGTPATGPKPDNLDLPPIEEVSAQEITPAGTHISTTGAGGSGGGGSSGGWSSRDPERDRLLGERGEEIVYLRELERVRDAGFESPESLVTWVSRDNPTADHDIRSVAADGATLWIEVKSTSGLDGSFDWPESEVAKAMAERGKYILCRVYRANSRQPIVKRFPDPLSMIESGHIRLGLGSVRAQVESAGSS